jgi:glycyl-tRNA synthetase beta chain
MIRFGLEQFSAQTAGRLETLTEDINVFFTRRIDRLLVDEGFAKDSVAAVTAVAVDHVPNVWKRVAALDQLRREPDFAALAVAFKRAVNILRKADDHPAADAADESLFAQPCEGALLLACRAVEQKVASQVQEGDFYAALRDIAALKAPVDAFFDGVMVMAEDAAVRRNRMALLQRVAALFTDIADFSRITT